ncbi:hypothetical protein MNBD_ALPHA01-666 [hydrothermal vent metagenome]|uniref:DUF3572 domain-containing protein n=1 Tax=hydrothermal vent metagenome TaxID=652676 RepID=A0A3B0SMY4_9ZZZZ
MNDEQAEILGLRALSYLAADEEILMAYLRLSGITPEELRNSAADPAILGSILDYFLHNEKRLIAFCEAQNIAPESLVRARKCLPGGETIPYSG